MCMGGIGHALSICLDSCGIGVWVGTSGGAWRGSPSELHQFVRVLLHFTQFCIQRQARHPPSGPWDHVPPHVWTNKSSSAATQGSTGWSPLCLNATAAQGPASLANARHRTWPLQSGESLSLLKTCGEWHTCDAACLTPLNLTHYRLAIWRGGFAYRIREPSVIRM